MLYNSEEAVPIKHKFSIVLKNTYKVLKTLQDSMRLFKSDVKIIFILFIAMILLSCKKENISGVIIGVTLLDNQSVSENEKLEHLINRTLKGDDRSLYLLNQFPCDGAAGCYDKGYIITQIIYKVGEENFIRMTDKCDKKELYGLEGYISAGLEYGDNDYDGESDNKVAEIEFPVLMKKLTEKNAL